MPKDIRFRRLCATWRQFFEKILSVSKLLSTTVFTVIDDLCTGKIYQLSVDGKHWIEVGNKTDGNGWPSSVSVLNNKIYITTKW